MPLTPGFAPGLGVEGIESGPLFDDLVHAIVIHRIVAERLAIDIDHDSERLAEGELFGGANVYSLRWQGGPGEALREISLGNLVRSIPGSPYLPIDAGGSESFALEAAARIGPVTLEALARYGSALEGRRRFRGNRLSIEADLADVGYARGRFFLLPDADIDEAGLRVAKSSATGPILIAGRCYALLARGSDWRLDNAGARLTLARPLAPGEELAVAYTKGGSDVGDPALGLQAIVGTDGLRDDFNSVDWPGYFGSDGATDWLFLRRQDLNSYWELRNTFVLDDLEPGQVPEQVEVQVLRTATFAPNPAYDELADRFRVLVAEGAISFEFPDATGRFQPRPFPGEEPFADPPYTSANNPFDPDNPVYGGLSYPPADASITTARVRFLVSTDTYLLAPGLIADSVRVTVDGQSLPASKWTVDPASGTITFAPGAIGPQSEVEVIYRWTPVAGAAREFVAALGAGMGDERLGGRNLVLLTLPIPDAPAPRLGAERTARLADSLDVHAALGAATGEKGWHAELTGSVAAGLSVADPAGVAIVADMEDDRRIGIGLSEAAWSLSTASTLLPLLPAPVTLGDRGEVRYENLWEDRPLGGAVLHDVSWDNAANPQFTYGEKAGPYSSADAPPGSGGPSLVLDVAFPAGATNAWAGVSTVLAGVDAGGARRLSIWLRGVGVTGDAGQELRIYVEALGKAREDLDTDSVIDGESSAADPGYAITPTGGASTVIGSDRFGEADGRRDTEDRNGNGVLDTADAGVAIGDTAGPTYWLASVPVGTSPWTEVTVDIAALVAANPGTFRELRGVRLTVVPKLAPTVPITGRVVIGSVAFSASALASSSASLSVREVTPEEDADLATFPLTDAYADVYQRLHGGPVYREDHGLIDKSLAADVVAAIPPGAQALAELPIAPPADLGAWRLLKLYVLVPAGNLLPAADDRFVLRLASGSDGLEAALPGSAFHEGWNEIAALLEPPWTVTVNGADAGSLTGSAGVVGRVSAIRFGLQAGALGIAAPLRFLTDEWHLAMARLAVQTAGRADASIGWRGTLLAAGGVPLLTDPLVSAGVEHRAGTFLGAADRVEDRWNAGARAGIAGVLAASLESGQSYTRPATPDPDVLAGLENGSSDRRSLSLVLDTGLPWAPALEHRWDRSRSVERDPFVATAGPQVVATDADRESLSLSERLELEAGLAQWFSFSRTWTRDARELVDAATGGSLSGTGSRGLLETGQAGLAYRWDRGDVSLTLNRDRVFAAPDAADPADGPWSYFLRLADLFAASDDALAGAAELTLRDRIALSLEVPRERILGSTLSMQAEYAELNVDPATGARDVNTLSGFSLALPTSPDGAGAVLITPDVSISLAGAYRGVDASLREADLLFSPWPGLLVVPLAWAWPDGWGRPQEHAAVDPFIGVSGVDAGSNTLTGRVALSARIARPAWYVPGRASISLKSETGRSDATRSQKRTVAATLGGDLTFAGGRSLTGDAEASFAVDYAARTRTLALSQRATVQLAGIGDGTLSFEQSSGWTRERQAIGDPRLSLFPGVPDDPAIVVAPRPDKDTLRGALTLSYAWRREGSASDADIEVRRTTHTERLSMESTLAWVAPGSVSSSVPIRLRFEHASEIEVSESFTLGISGKAAAGVERRTGAGDDLLLPAIGFEVEITGKIRF
jgi:hypothetical protein